MYDFKTFIFGRGPHLTREHGMCAMEAVAYIAGEPHSDRPQCADPLITSLLMILNDNTFDDNERRELVSPFIFRMVGTRNEDAILARREMWIEWVPNLEGGTCGELRCSSALRVKFAALIDRMIRLTEPQEVDVTARVREMVEHT